MEGDGSSFQIQCFTCGEWYSSDDPDVNVSMEGYIPYMTNYEYCCFQCDTESITKKPASFIQVCITALANLTAQSAHTGNPRVFFSLEDEIIPFIWDNWDIICTKRSKTGTWRNNLATKLSTETRIFCINEETTDEQFGLVDQDLTTISPRRYESKTVPGRTMVAKMKRKPVDNDSPAPMMPMKRPKTDREDRGLCLGYPLDHPFNKDGFRYTLAERDPHAPMEISPEDGAAYRPIVPECTLLSLNDAAPQLKVGMNRLTVTGEKGYSMIRATHGVSRGNWFYEVHIDDLPGESAVRLGWSQFMGNLQAPSGYDKFSYSWRSKFGTKFHQSYGKHYSEGYGAKDCVGFLIELPEHFKVRDLPRTHKDKIIIKFKNHFYFEEKDEPVEEVEKSLKTLPGSKITFFKNGVPQGVAWMDIFAGEYYPAFSFFKDATVTANMGPKFKFPPSGGVSYQPMCEAAELKAVEQTMSEMLFYVLETSMATSE